MFLTYRKLNNKLVNSCFDQWQKRFRGTCKKIIVRKRNEKIKPK